MHQNFTVDVKTRELGGRGSIASDLSSLFYKPNVLVR